MDFSKPLTNQFIFSISNRNSVTTCNLEVTYLHTHKNTISESFTTVINFQIFNQTWKFIYLIL